MLLGGGEWGPRTAGQRDRKQVLGRRIKKEKVLERVNNKKLKCELKKEQQGPVVVKRGHFRKCTGADSTCYAVNSIFLTLGCGDLFIPAYKIQPIPAA